MSITTVYQKCKQYVAISWRILVTIPSSIPRDGIVVLLFILATLAGFGLGFIAGGDHATSGKNIWIEQQVSASTSATTQGKVGVATDKAQVVPETIPINNHTNSGRAVVASKNGGRYYLASCNGAKRIHDKNKIWFASAEAASAKGYTPAQRCPGL